MGGSLPLRVRGGGGEARRIIRGGRDCTPRRTGLAAPTTEDQLQDRGDTRPRTPPWPSGTSPDIASHPPSKAGLGLNPRGEIHELGEQLSSQISGCLPTRAGVGKRRGMSALKCRFPGPTPEILILSIWAQSQESAFNQLPRWLLGNGSGRASLSDTVWMESLADVRAGPTFAPSLLHGLRPSTGATPSQWVQRLKAQAPHSDVLSFCPTSAPHRLCDLPRAN